MKRLIVKWLFITLGIFIASYFLRGFEVSTVTMMILGAAVLGLLNVIIRPFLILLTLPINILTLGLFTFVINGALLYTIGHFLKGWHIQSFMTAMLAALIISLISLLSNIFLEK